MFSAVTHNDFHDENKQSVLHAFDARTRRKCGCELAAKMDADVYESTVGESVVHWQAGAPPVSLAVDRRKQRQALARRAAADEAAAATVAVGPNTTTLGRRQQPGTAAAAPAPTYFAEAPSRRVSSAASSAGPVGAYATDMGAKRRTGGETTRLGPVHDTEALNEQVLTLKKQLASSHAENKLLRVAKERMEVELRRAEHEGEQALRTGGLVEGVGPTAARPELRLLHALKAKTRELQDELQAKEAQIGELSGQTRGVRVKELEIQAKVYLEEARRLRELFDRQASEHADAEQALRERHSYELTVKEQELEALRQERSRLKKQNGAIDEELGRWMDENEVLRERVHALESAAGPGASSGGGGGGGGGGAAAVAAPLVPTLASEVVTLKAKLREALMRQKTLQKDKERAEADKLAIFQELNEANLRLEAELKQERTKARRFERMHHAAASDLALAQAELLRATRS